MAPYRILLTSDDTHRAVLCPNREGGLGHIMGKCMLWRPFNQPAIPAIPHIETNHKPLVPLLSTKHVEDLPARVHHVKQGTWKALVHRHAVVSTPCQTPKPK